MRTSMWKHSILFMICLSIILSIPKARAQYSRAEIDRAVEYLTNRGVLTGLVASTTQDRTKLTSRPDVLMACYEIMQQLDNLEEQLATRTNTIDQSIRDIRSRSGRVGGSNVDYDTLVRRVLGEVEKKLPDMQANPVTEQSINTIRAKNAQIERDLEALRNALDRAEPGLVGAAEIKERTRQNRIIAITGVAVSALIAILAAR